MLQKLPSMPDIVEGLSFDSGVTNTSRVSTSNEMSDSSSNSRRAMPQDFSGTSIEHGGRPDSEDDVVLVEGAIINESLVLSNSRS